MSINFARYRSYLKTVIRHKIAVAKYARQLNCSLWIQFFHDWDKFLPDEFIPYVLNFYNSDGTPKKEKNYYENAAFQSAWRKHIHRNKHHWQHWVLMNDDGSIVPLPMPAKYVAEMVADWAGASKTYGGNLIEWYEKTRPHRRLHPETEQMVELFMSHLRLNPLTP